MTLALDTARAGARVGLEGAGLDAVVALARRIEADADLDATVVDCLERLRHDAPSDALAHVRALDLEQSLGRSTARTLYLVLALGEVPDAEARHAARGVDPEITRATLGDLAVWARHFHKQTGTHGVTFEILDWAQRYLRGDLYRVGSLQFDLRPFEGDLRVHRHRTTRALVARTLDGRPIDLREGLPLEGGAQDTGPEGDAPKDGWERVLEPGVPILDMHVPADSFLSMRAVVGSVRDARALFERLRPDVAPAGIAGEAWILDPQVRALLPRNVGIHALQAACHLYPSKLPEEKTVRRLFGPDATRASLAALPRDRMNRLQRAVADHLADPARGLRARGGFLLADDVERFLEGGLGASRADRGE